MNKPNKLKPNAYSITIGWLYPDLMSTYGDRGNIIVLQKRCEWRGIKVKVEKISLDTKYQILNTCDLFFMGGAQDREQEIVNKNLQKKKGNVLHKLIEGNTPGLYICGGYQFLGKYYKAADGTKIPGLGVFDIYTEHPGDQARRLIGNIIIKPNLTTSYQLQATSSLVGFENHGGRTYLGKDVHPFAKVQKGYGNNGNDKTEGMIYKNSIGSYLHGPILPKNPELADWLIEKALEVKYKEEYKLESLGNTLEQKAKAVVADRF